MHVIPSSLSFRNLDPGLYSMYTTYSSQRGGGQRKLVAHAARSVPKLKGTVHCVSIHYVERLHCALQYLLTPGFVHAAVLT